MHKTPSHCILLVFRQPVRIPHDDRTSSDAASKETLDGESCLRTSRLDVACKGESHKG